MSVAEDQDSSRRYKLASQAAPSEELAAQYCYRYFEVSTVRLHLFNGLGLVIADLNYCQA